MKQTRAPRRTPAQWQAIIDQQQSSGLSAIRFCQQHGIAYANFSKWRQRLGRKDINVEPCSAPKAAAFIDVSALTAQTEMSWHIVLKLGNGVELCLSQR